MKRLLVIIALTMAGALPAYTQTGQVCISQESANKCAMLSDKVEALENALTVRDKAIEELKIALAKETQRGVDQEAAIIRLTAIMDLLIKNYTKPKKFGIINF